MNITAIGTIYKSIGCVNMQSCFRMNIDGEVIRQLKAGRTYKHTLNGTSVNFIIKISEHLANILIFQWRNILRRQIHHGTGCNEILQAFFGKNSLVGAVDLLKDGKMMFHKVIHFFIRHGTIMHVFADDFRCNIAACAWLRHHDLQRIRRCVADIFLKYFQYIGITAYQRIAAFQQITEKSLIEFN